MSQLRSVRHLTWALVCAMVGLIPWWQMTVWAAPPTLGQHGAANASSTTVGVTLNSLTTGSRLVVGIFETDSNLRTISSVADGVNANYDSVIGPITSTGAAGNRRCWIYTQNNITTSAGSLTITVTLSATATVVAQVVEVLGGSAADTTSSVAESADATSHNMAASMTTAADIFVYGIGSANASLGTFTPTSSPAFTSLAGDTGMTTSSVSQYYSNATGLSANNVAWTSSTSRTVANCIASWVTTGGGGGSGKFLSLLGVG